MRLLFNRPRHWQPYLNRPCDPRDHLPVPSAPPAGSAPPASRPAPPAAGSPEAHPPTPSKQKYRPMWKATRIRAICRITSSTRISFSLLIWQKVGWRLNCAQMPPWRVKQHGMPQQLPGHSGPQAQSAEHTQRPGQSAARLHKLRAENLELPFAKHSQRRKTNGRQRARVTHDHRLVCATSAGGRAATHPGRTWCR